MEKPSHRCKDCGSLWKYNPGYLLAPLIVTSIFPAWVLLLRKERCEGTNLEQIYPKLEDEVHVMPNFDGERVHVSNVLCWCFPRRHCDCDLLVVHNRWGTA